MLGLFFDPEDGNDRLFWGTSTRLHGMISQKLVFFSIN
jgi:hypothetical protein